MASAIRHSIKSSSKFPGEVLSARQVKREEGADDKDAKALNLSFVTSLQACAKKNDLSQGIKIHADIRNSGLLRENSYLGTTLVTMYAKCGALDRAQNVLDELPVRSVASWSAMIAGYVRHGLGKEALGCFHRMRGEGISPGATTYACTLKACGITQDIDLGKKIHDEIAKQGLLQKNVVLGTSLVDMYAKCGVLMKAQNVLDELPVRDVVSWSALIGGYVRHGYGQEALGCFHRMQSEGLSPDAITYACILKACGIMQDICMGKEIHKEIASHGLLKKNVVLGNALVDMYAKCGVLTKAQNVFDELASRNIASWSALIGGYTEHGHSKEALRCFQQMQREGLSPNAIIYACILKSCAMAKDSNTGKKIHDEIESQGLLKSNVGLGTALVDMYAKCGLLMKAHKVLDNLAVRSVVSWSALIAGYAQHGDGKEALECFLQMQKEGISPDAITYACVLKACGIVQDVDRGKRIHDEIAKKGLLRKNVILGTALIDMYAKCGALMKAQNVLDELPVQSDASWCALIAGYAQHGHGKEALGCFNRMKREGLSPDAITYSCILKACGITEDADMGKKIHDELVSQGLLEENVILGTALVDMYAKCGLLMKARKTLEELPSRDAVSWSALIAGFAQQGQGQEALNCFQRMRKEGFSPNVVSWSALIGGFAQQGLAKESLDCFKWMQQEGISPDAITLVGVLNACSHSGLVDEGELYFNNMRERYGITPNNEHYTCMVDLFGRARLFDKALTIIKMMPSPDYPPVWFALLGACRKWRNVKLGRFSFERVVQLDPSDAAAYVLMSNIYTASGMHDEAQNIERMRMENAAWQKPGSTCWVDRGWISS